MARPPAALHCVPAAFALLVAGMLVPAPVAAEAGTVVPVPIVSGPDPLRSPVAPYRGRGATQPLAPTERQQLQNYRTDLQSRRRELEQARANTSPRLGEERREVQQELDRLRRLTR